MRHNLSTLQPLNSSTQTTDLAIRADGIIKSFGDRRVLDGLSLKLRRGEIMGFLGTNGAGKTTTVKILLGFLKPDSGSVEIFGGAPGAEATRARIGFMPEIAYYYPYLNIGELLEFYGGLCGMSRTEVRAKAPALIRRVGLEAAGDKLLKTYSKGMLQRAGIAQALLHDPELLVLDEPFTGLDPLARAYFRDMLHELRDAGKTIFFSSHELSETETVCDHIAIVKEGKVVLQGATRDIVGDGRGNLERLFLDVLGGKPHL